MRKTVCVIFLMTAVLVCSVFIPLNVFSDEIRTETIWFKKTEAEVVVASMDIIKTAKASLGFQYTSPNSEAGRENFDNVTGIGMFRLTANDEFGVKADGKWINAEHERNSDVIRTSFSRNVKHNIKMRFVRNENNPFVEWYIDGVLFTKTYPESILPMTALSVIGEEQYGDGYVISNFSVTGYETENITNTTSVYTMTYGRTQGVNGWYFSEFGSSAVHNLNYNNTHDSWSSVTGYPFIKSDYIFPGDNGAGYKFVSPQKGMARLKGSVSLPYSESAEGDGTIAYIYKKSKLLWEGRIIYGETTDYDITVPLDKNDVLYFKIEKNKNNNYDATKWIPTVEYTDSPYTEEAEEYIYLQKFSDGLMPLTGNSETGRYTASDDVSFIGKREVRLKKNIELIRRLDIKKDGRYRVYGSVTATGTGGGIILKVLKNNEVAWEQLFPDGETGVIDFRVFTAKGDTVDVMATETGHQDYGTAQWDFDIEKYVGTLFCKATDSAGRNYIEEESFTLSSLIEKSESIDVYSIKNDMKYPMKYETYSKKWVSSIEGDTGYLTKSTAYPGTGSDTVLDITVAKKGKLHIDGELMVSDAGDGVVSKIFLNDKLIWSSRVGGERPVRWDEPFDVSFFSNIVNVVANVNEGDVLTFLFDQWRMSNNDIVDISGINLRYVNGDILSDTTKWKLSKSILLDTEEKILVGSSERKEIDVFNKDGVVYISEDGLETLFGQGFESRREGLEINGKLYVSLRDVSEDEGKNVVWTKDGYVLIYGGLPIFFGYSEISEIETAYDTDNLYLERAEVAVIDKKGKNINRLTRGITYYVKVYAENYIGDEMDMQIIVAQYDESNTLVDVVNSKKYVVPYGNTITLNQNSADDAITFKAHDNMKTTKIFMWSGLEEVKPIACLEK